VRHLDAELSLNHFAQLVGPRKVARELGRHPLGEQRVQSAHVDPRGVARLA